MVEFPSTWLHKRYHAHSRVYYTGPEFKTGEEVLVESKTREQQLSRYRRRKAARKILRQETTDAYCIDGGAP